ncbi:MAG: FAD-dependent oxidoreductase [Leptolyngbyaceae bacterium]|nr:FAD-dependent oxidoreductase [Leptolyngbyaceae bacterium]
MDHLTTDVLVVGGGTGGVVAALQAARRGAKTILVSEFPWLGGMLTSAGVCAPDGNELAAFQTGVWGAFLRELRQRQPEGLNHAWVSFFTYNPQVGAQIFADWVSQLPNLQWIVGQVPLAVLRQGDRITGVQFPNFTIEAKITLDGTELGDLLAIAEIPHRWGWELQSEWQEPSAPATEIPLMQRYSVQSPTWVVILQDFGEGTVAPAIPEPPHYNPDHFRGSWDHYGVEEFLNYGRLPGDRFMINWPQYGNDYGEGVERLIQSPKAKAEFLQESLWHTQGFAHFIQTNLGQRYGLAPQIFPHTIGDGAYALHPYYRESRRLQGLVTVQEQDILPMPGSQVAPLPVDETGQMSAIAYGNYANDHHYPGTEIPLQPKSIRWGGRWTGTPFTIPYGSLVPATTDGFLVCEKNISVSHIANGATRLQPAVMGIGQAAGMAAALCIEHNCQPRNLNVRLLQSALLTDPTAPAAVIPLFNLPPEHPDWLKWQHFYCDRPQDYPVSGNCPLPQEPLRTLTPSGSQEFLGVFQRVSTQDYKIALAHPTLLSSTTLSLVTLRAEVDRQLQTYPTDTSIRLYGQLNPSGGWLLVDSVGFTPS